MKESILIFTLLMGSTLTFAQTEDPELYEYCEELPLNTAMKVIIPPSRSKTTTQKYTLLRKDEKTYDIFLNLQFKASKNYNEDRVKREDVNEAYRQGMHSCFQRFNHFLIDERGRNLRLHIYDEERNSNLPSPPPLVKIKIEGNKHRSNSGAYNSEIDCPTMIHEAFHLLGLIDEYKEKWKGFNHNFFSLAFNPLVPTSDKVKPAFDCRAIGPKYSVMHNQWGLYSGSSLYSGHVNAIIYPHCKNRNEKYYNCAKYAYRTSFENNGAMLNISNCINKVPEYCKDEDWVKTEQ
jgi:hypothetical protein